MPPGHPRVCYNPGALSGDSAGIKGSAGRAVWPPHVQVFRKGRADELSQLFPICHHLLVGRGGPPSVPPGAFIRLVVMLGLVGIKKLACKPG